MESDADQLILEILERLAAKPGYSATVSPAEFPLFEELETSGFIVGQIGPDTHDAPLTMVEGVKMTATGRRHMRELKKQLKSAITIPTTPPVAAPAAGPSALFPVSISAFAYELLDSIWDHYSVHREWPTTWAIHSRFEKARVMSARAELKSDHLIENSSSQGNIYELRIGGVLLTKSGRQAEQLLIRYVDYLRRRYKSAPNERTVTSADAQTHIGLSAEQTNFLGDLVFIAGFFGAGSRGAEWSATIPTEIEDCLPSTSSRDFVREMIAKRNTPSLPIDIENRQRQVFAAQPNFLDSMLDPTDHAPKGRLYQVFVSSTFIDLKEERHEVMMALLQTKCIPVGMERFPATDADQMAYIRPVIDNCDYYIVILAGRYGSVPDGKSVSYTEMEFDYAVSRGKYVIVMCHHDVGTIPLNLSEKSDLGRQKLQAFYDKVRKGRICDHWSNAHELASKVKTAIYDAIEKHPQPGWVRATTLASPAERKAPPRVPSAVPANSAKLVGIPVRVNFLPKGANPVSQLQVAEFEIKRSVDQLLLLLSRRLEKPATANSLKGSFERVLTPTLNDELVAHKGGMQITPYGYCSIKIAGFQRVIDSLNAEDLVQWKAASRGDEDQAARWVISKTGVKRLSRLRANGEHSPE